MSILEPVLHLVALTAGLSIVFAVKALLPVPRRYVDRFLRRYPIRVTPASGPMVVRRLARVRSARTIGGLAGALLGGAAGLFGLRFNVVFAIAIGYLLGAVVAELPSRRDRTNARRPAASLVPRRLRDYVPRWFVVAPVPIVAVTLVIEVAAAAGARRPNLGDDAAWHGFVGVSAMILASVLTLATARTILYRRQPYTTPEMVSADDALRAASLHCVCGGGVAIVAMIGSTSLWSVAVRSDVQLLRWITPWLGLALMFSAYVAWFGLRVSPWLVRRRYAAPVAPPS